MHVKAVDIIKAVSENNDVSANELREHLKAFDITPQLLTGAFASEPAHTQAKDIPDGGKKVVGQYD